MCADVSHCKSENCVRYKNIIITIITCKISVRDKGFVVYHFHVSDEIEIKIMHLAHRTNEGITNKVNLFFYLFNKIMGNK